MSLTPYYLKFIPEKKLTEGLVMQIIANFNS